MTKILETAERLISENPAMAAPVVIKPSYFGFALIDQRDELVGSFEGEAMARDVCNAVNGFEIEQAIYAAFADAFEALGLVSLERASGYAQIGNAWLSNESREDIWKGYSAAYEDAAQLALDLASRLNA